MDVFVRRLIRSSLVWLGIGGALGVGMTFRPVAWAWRTAHLHALIAGFVAMMIFGVAYHVMPRFAGIPLHRPAWASAHVWLANAGLLLLVAGWILRPEDPALASWLLRAGGLVYGAGGLLFIGNIWKTTRAPTVVIRAAPFSQGGQR